MEKLPCVYIVASKKDGVLYLGVTSSLSQRVWQHKNRWAKGFSSKYWTHKLVWFEVHENMAAAITREKQIKKWRREWKIQMIEAENPEWEDLYSRIASLQAK